MKNIFIGISTLWVISILFFTLILQTTLLKTDSKSYRITVNRIHNELSTLIIEKNELKKTMAYISKQIELNSDIASITIINLQDKEQLGLLTGDDIKTDKLMFLPVDNTYDLVRYEISTDTEKLYPFVIFYILSIFLLTMILITLGLIINKRLIKPLKLIATLPKKLAKGDLSCKIQQDKYGYYRELLWGLDMLRQTLENEKNKNYKLEKNRKTLVASLSHDIYTPLSYIQNYCDSLLDGIYQDEDSKRYALNIIKEKSKVIERLTTQLLNSSKQLMKDIEIEVQELYTHDLFDKLNQLINHKINLHKIDYDLSKPNNNWLIYGDIEYLMQVFDNIIENAVKYGDGNQINIKTDKEEHYLLVKIENTGQPIPKNELKYVFSSFYRGSNVGNQSGHGLGLYIAKRIMKTMGGDIYLLNVETGVCVVVVIKIVQ